MMPADSGAEDEPGFWRRIELYPASEIFAAGLEDDVHRFLVYLSFRNGIVADVEVKGDRIPYTTCAGAGGFFKDALVGKALRDVAELDSHLHCTHVFDLAVLAARHVADQEPTRFDVRVTDAMEGRKRATVYQNGTNMLRWEVEATLIHGPGVFDGKDLRQFSVWKNLLSPTELEYAAMLRRVVMVSGSRGIPVDDATRPVDRGPGRLGACFTYQEPRVAEARRDAPIWRKDFSHGAGPLQGFEVWPGESRK